MNVRRAIELLQQLPPDAEVMIEAPFSCSKSPVVSEAGNLILPVRSLRPGYFYFPKPFHFPKPPGSQSVTFVGTDVLGMDQGIENP